MRGVFPLGANKKLGDVLADVGVISSRADLTNIKLIRDGATEYLNYFNDASFLLENGDKLVVSQKPDSVYVSGFVKQPASYIYRAGYTVEEYLNIAGGATREGSASRVTVFRDGKELDGDDVRIVQPGDVILVKASYLTIIENYLNIVSPILSVIVTARAFDLFE